MAEIGKGVSAGKLAINVQKRLTRAQEKVKTRGPGHGVPLCNWILRFLLHTHHFIQLETHSVNGIINIP